MKWYTYVWLFLRFCLYSLFLHICISIVAGITYGMVFLPAQTTTTDLAELTTQIMSGPVVWWIGIVSLITSIILSAWLNYRHYKILSANEKAKLAQKHQ